MHREYNWYILAAWVKMNHQSINMYIIWSLVMIKRQILHLIPTMKQYFGTQTVLFITFKVIKTIMIPKLTSIQLNYWQKSYSILSRTNKLPSTAYITNEHRPSSTTKHRSYSTTEGEAGLQCSDHEQPKGASWEVRGDLQPTLDECVRTEYVCCLAYKTEGGYWSWCEKRQKTRIHFCVYYNW